MADRTFTCTARDMNTQWVVKGIREQGFVNVGLVALPAGTRVTVTIESPEPEKPVDYHFHSTIPGPDRPSTSRQARALLRSLDFASCDDIPESPPPPFGGRTREERVEGRTFPGHLLR